MDTANRKLIRPNLNGAKEQISSNRSQKPRTAPLDQTHAESFYYLKQMQAPVGIRPTLKCWMELN